jgi:phosphate transport system permease protein
MSKTTQKHIQKLQRADRLFRYAAMACTGFALLMLALLVWDIISKGIGRIGIDFLSNLPSRFAERSGIRTALAGMMSLLLFTVLVSLPIGILAGVYLEEYGKKNRFAKFVEINISNLAGVPSVIYGILGLQVFVRMAGMGNSLLAGAFTLALLIMPIIIVATREAIKAVPQSLRDASYGMGATKWQTTRRVVIPSALGGILTGIILAISRAIGETAPLLVIGALVYVPFIPEGPHDQFTTLPIQVFNWTTRPQANFIANAAAGIIILLLITFLLNAVAVYIRNKWYRKIKY